MKIIKNLFNKKKTNISSNDKEVKEFLKVEKTLEQEIFKEEFKREPSAKEREILHENIVNPINSEKRTIESLEQERLESVKKKILKRLSEIPVSKSTLTQEEKLRILESQGSISPTSFVPIGGKRTPSTAKTLDSEQEENSKPIDSVDESLWISDYFKEIKDEEEEEVEDNEKELEVNDQDSDSDIDIDSEVEEDIETEEDVEVEVEVEETPEETYTYSYPSMNLLEDNSPDDVDKRNDNIENAREVVHKINSVFRAFNVDANVSNKFEVGPAITVFYVHISPTTKINSVLRLENEIKLQLKLKSLRMQTPVNNKKAIGIEVPNKLRTSVSLRNLLENMDKNSFNISIPLGRDLFNRIISFDLTKAPHLLIAGATGSGKSVALNAILCSLIFQYSPKDVKLLLIDPKRVEFTNYEKLPHLLSPIIVESQDANVALRKVIKIMEDRFKVLSQNRVRNIDELNEKLIKKGEDKIPYIVVVIDELSDLMLFSAKEVETSIIRITQKARAAGIHMIVATQRPSTNIITGVIKANIPSRIAFATASSIDSRTILDATGSEKLLGKGDMLVSMYGRNIKRGQAAFLDLEEIDNLTSFLIENNKYSYEFNIDDLKEVNTQSSNVLLKDSDPTYQSARRLVIAHDKATISLIQRYLKVSYLKASNIMDTLEANNVIGPQIGSKPRIVLEVDDEDEDDYE